MRERERMFAERAALMRMLKATTSVLRMFAKGDGSPQQAAAVAGEAEVVLALVAQADAVEADQGPCRLSTARTAHPVPLAMDPWVLRTGTFAISGFLVGLPAGFAACLALL